MNKQRGLLSKTLVFGVIVIFVGLAIQQSVAVQPEEVIIDVEPKDYLFQTIIDIGNNPEVKNLLEQYNHNLFTSDYDYKSTCKQLLLKKPRLLYSMLFTKPSITSEYLNKCYNKGIEITNILGEDESLEIIESVEVTNIKVVDDFINIIVTDEILSDRLATLKEMNKDLNLNGDYPIICYILFIPTFAVGLIWGSLITIYVILNYYLPIISEIFFYITLPFGVLIFIFAALMFAFGCVSY